MKIAIVGAGFSGLGLAYSLLRSCACKVVLFDPSGIGGGASGIATGLLHPYPGEQARRSWRASEAIAATLGLLQAVEKAVGQTVASYDGIVRVVQNEAQRSAFLSHITVYGDVEQIDNTSFLIRSGVTVYAQRYLQGLWDLVARAGGVLVRQKVDSFAELEGYDHVILAVGAGLAGFAEASRLRTNLIKGQVLVAKVPLGLQPELKSRIGKGYVAKGEGGATCYLGSTYEKSFVSEEPDLDFALQEILPKAALFFPEVQQMPVVDCLSGVRVCRVGQYYPMIARFSPSHWALTAMGSRGLLYHAFFSQLLSQAIVTGDVEKIPREVFFSSVLDNGKQGKAAACQTN